MAVEDILNELVEPVDEASDLRGRAFPRLAKAVGTEVRRAVLRAGRNGRIVEEAARYGATPASVASAIVRSAAPPMVAEEEEDVLGLSGLGQAVEQAGEVVRRIAQAIPEAAQRISESVLRAVEPIFAPPAKAVVPPSTVTPVAPSIFIPVAIGAAAIFMFARKRR
jgi:hypothetical protein